MARRRCQYCTAPLGRLASLLLIVHTCSNCAYRMSIGHTPARPPKSAPPVTPVERGGSAPPR